MIYGPNNLLKKLYGRQCNTQSQKWGTGIRWAKDRFSMTRLYRHFAKGLKIKWTTEQHEGAVNFKVSGETEPTSANNPTGSKWIRIK